MKGISSTPRSCMIKNLQNMHEKSLPPTTGVAHLQQVRSRVGPHTGGRDDRLTGKR
jgi:hypothetical protein